VNWADVLTGSLGCRFDAMENDRTENRHDSSDRLHCECGRENPGFARFCQTCGKALVATMNSAGRAFHPAALGPPVEMTAVERAAHLFVAVESAWGGGPLIGTEPLQLVLFNGGYALRTAVLQIDAFDRAGQRVFGVEKVAVDIPRGGRVAIEVASYEIPEPVQRVRVSLVSAEYA